MKTFEVLVNFKINKTKEISAKRYMVFMGKKHETNYRVKNIIIRSLDLDEGRAIKRDLQ